VTRRRSTANPVRAVHRPDKPVRLHVQATGEILEGPLLRCLNAATPALDAGHTLTITPTTKKADTNP
jgi:hypothetical protein